MLDPRQLGNGQEQYERFKPSAGRKSKAKVQYDYRNDKGELFSTVKSTLAECRAARDAWAVSTK
jgi:hypothetical protein